MAVNARSAATTKRVIRPTRIAPQDCSRLNRHEGFSRSSLCTALNASGRGTMSNGRSERRIPKTVTVEVCLADDLTLKERALTENVSAHGVRVLTQRSMRPKQQAMIISLNDGVWSRAKVVYCQRAAENRFAVGLELSASVEPWASPY